MIGGGGVVGAFFILALLYALGIIGVILCIFSLIAFLRKSLRTATVLLISGAVLISPILTTIHKSNEIKKTAFLIQAAIPFKLNGFRLHPKVYTDELGGTPRQILWGEVDLDVTLPNGGTIRGSTNRISLGSSTEDEFEYLQVFFQPDMSFYRATSIEDVFSYWKKQGQVLWEFPGSARIDCGDYIIKLGEIGGWVTFTATTNKES